MGNREQPRSAKATKHFHLAALSLFARLPQILRFAIRSDFSRFSQWMGILLIHLQQILLRFPTSDYNGYSLNSLVKHSYCGANLDQD